jgi:hypothetical protein
MSIHPACRFSQPEIHTATMESRNYRSLLALFVSPVVRTYNEWPIRSLYGHTRCIVGCEACPMKLHNGATVFLFSVKEILRGRFCWFGHLERLVVAAAIDRWHLRPHGPQIGCQRSAMVNAVIVQEAEIYNCRKIE